MKLVGLGKMTAAVPPLEAACRINPNYAPAHVYLGWAFYSEGKLPQAITEYQTALRIEPDARTHYCLGLALEAKLDIPGAKRRSTKRRCGLIRSMRRRENRLAVLRQ